MLMLIARVNQALVSIETVVLRRRESGNEHVRTRLLTSNGVVWSPFLGEGLVSIETVVLRRRESGNEHVRTSPNKSGLDC